METGQAFIGKQAKEVDKPPFLQYLKVSIIIPAYNCAQSISMTLDKILHQKYPDLEVIVIDGSSTDSTMEVLKRYDDIRLRLYSVASFKRYEMFNKGISLARGDYINFLFPGDFFLRPDTLQLMMKLALDQGKPHLVYSGTLLRDGFSEEKFLFRQLSLELLKRGQQPTSLQACWFKRETFMEIGKFYTDFHMRGGFDLLCRFLLQGTLRYSSIRLALTDYDLRGVTRHDVLCHFWETLKTVYYYFGLVALISWLFRQKDIKRFFTLWIRSVKAAFLGK